MALGLWMMAAALGGPLLASSQGQSMAILASLSNQSYACYVDLGQVQQNSWTAPLREHSFLSFETTNHSLFQSVAPF